MGRKRDYYNAFVAAANLSGMTRRGRTIFPRRIVAAGNRFRTGGSRTQTRSRRRMQSGRGVTFEHDRQRVYRRKRMPYRKKRRWIKAIKRNDALDLKKCGAQTYVFNTSVTDSNNNPANHGFMNFALYGAHDTATSINNDLHYIGENDNELDSTANLGVHIDQSTRLYFQSGVLDLTIRNSTFRNDSVGGNVLEGTLEVDIYEITSRKKWTEFDKTAQSLIELNDVAAIFDEAETDMKGIRGANGADYRLRGMTPWDATYAISRYGIKIHKKTKYRISAGNTITYQTRDPKNRSISYLALNEAAGGNLPGWTKWMLVYYKLIPGLTPGTADGTYVTKLDVGVTRKYMYKVPNRTEKRTSHVAR